MKETGLGGVATPMAVRIPPFLVMFVAIVFTTHLGAANYNITTPPAGALTDATEGVAYSITYSHTGGCTPSKYVIASGALPSGLTLGNEGVLSGTPAPGSAGHYSFSVKVDKSGQWTCPIPLPQSDTKSYTLQVLSSVPLAITTSGLSDAREAQSYSAMLDRVGGVPSFTWSEVGLPDGLTLDPMTGIISGTPATNTYLLSPYNVDITITDSKTPTPETFTVNFSLVVLQPVLDISSPSALASGVDGQPFYTKIEGEFGTLPYAWSATGLPAGLGIDPATGEITGTLGVSASASSPYTVNVTLTDAILDTATRSYQLFAKSNSSSTLSVATSALATAEELGAYGFQMLAFGGDHTYTWSASGLPPGLSIDATGFISGAPAAGTASASPYYVVFTLMDGSGGIATLTLLLNIFEAGGSPAALVPASLTLPAGREGSAYNVTLGASGGVAPYTWELVSGSLPAGLSLIYNGQDWELNGTFSSDSIGIASFTLELSDSGGQATDVPYTIAINGDSASFLTITTISLPAATEGETYIPVAIKTSGGSGAITIAASGLPDGLTLVSSGGKWYLLGAVEEGSVFQSIYPVFLYAVDSSTPVPLTASATLNLYVYKQSSSGSGSGNGGTGNPEFPVATPTLMGNTGLCALGSGHVPLMPVVLVVLAGLLAALSLHTRRSTE